VKNTRIAKGKRRSDKEWDDVALKVGMAMLSMQSSQVKLILSPKQRAKPAASRTRTCTNAAVCIASGECPYRF
jgi:hypothetical protein